MNIKSEFSMIKQNSMADESFNNSNLINMTNNNCGVNINVNPKYKDGPSIISNNKYSVSTVSNTKDISTSVNQNINPNRTIKKGMSSGKLNQNANNNNSMMKKGNMNGTGTFGKKGSTVGNKKK